MAPGFDLLVTGADGQLGRDVMLCAARRDLRAIGLGRAELDVTDAARTQAVIAACAPRAIIHCAAYTAVDAAEEHPEIAYAINEAGAQHVARAARAADAHLVHVSTDYVFAGDDPVGADENTPTGPGSVYGASKLAGEVAVVRELPDAAIVRTSWLFGEHGSNFVKTIIRLAHERDVIDVIDDQHGSPTFTRHLADLLVTCAIERTRGIVHAGGSPPTTWHGLARAILDELGDEVSCELRATTSAAWARSAREAGRSIAERPACSILRSTRGDVAAVGDWREGVRRLVAASREAR